MHVAVTTRFLLPGGHLEGLGRYTFETLRELVQQQPDWQFHFLFDRAYDARYLLAPNVVPHVLAPPARHPLLIAAWYEVAVAAWLRRHQPAALLSPEGFTTLRTRVPRVLVLHDLTYLHRPQDMSALFRRYYAWFVPRWAHAAAQLITVSDATRQDVAAQFGLSAKHIRVAHNAPAAHFQPQPAAAQVATRQRFSAGQPYFLYVGALQPRKNLGNLLRAFALFKAEGGPVAEAMQLLLVGRSAWQNGPLREVFRQLPPAVQGAVRFTGRVSEAELASLYAAALATTYAPFFEGFGLPVVEAQASGSPVLTSTVSSLPEAAGGPGSAVLCNPHDPADLARGLHALAHDEALRARLRTAGLANAARFSWAASATVLGEALREVSGQ